MVKSCVGVVFFKTSANHKVLSVACGNVMSNVFVVVGRIVLTALDCPVGDKICISTPMAFRLSRILVSNGFTSVGSAPQLLPKEVLVAFQTIPVFCVTLDKVNKDVSASAKALSFSESQVNEPKSLPDLRVKPPTVVLMASFRKPVNATNLGVVVVKTPLVVFKSVSFVSVSNILVAGVGNTEGV